MSKEEVQAEQKDMSYEEVKAKMEASSEFMLELDNLPVQKHSWTDRGLKWTCENAGHPYHEAWRTKKAAI
jgi:hypothetical protein